MKHPILFVVPLAAAAIAIYAAEYSPPPASPASKLRAWSQLATSAKQDALAADSNITGSNATLNGWLKLSGQTNQIGDNGIALTFNGSVVGAGGDTVWTNQGNGTVVMNDASVSELAFPGFSTGVDFNFTPDDNTPIATFTLNAAGTNTASSANFVAGPGYEEFWFNRGNDVLMDLWPSADASTTPYTFSTAVAHTNGLLVDFHNASVGAGGVDYLGNIQVRGLTGITTTNTFYSVSANLLSTITNVVVVQGGIITGWTVTP